MSDGPSDDFPRQTHAVRDQQTLADVTLDWPEIIRAYNARFPHDQIGVDDARRAAALPNPHGFQLSQRLGLAIVIWLRDRVEALRIDDQVRSRDQIVAQRSIDEEREDLNAQQAARYVFGRGMAHLALLAAFEKPAADVLGPDRPRLKFGDNPEILEREPTFGAYLALAIETGNAMAIDAIRRWMTTYAKSGPKLNDWLTILERFELERRAVRAKRTDATQDVIDREAAIIVGGQFGIEPSSIIQRWKKRQEFAPGL